jgi:predicted HTH transcriptional regulator
VNELGETRRRSAALFGNEKIAEVVVALNLEGTATAQQIHTTTRIAHSMIRDALGRLVQGGVVRALPKAGHSRSEQYYQPVEGNVWTALVTMTEALLHEVHDLAIRETS